ncbi:hypothetical protein, partial [Kineococcus sp. SYSU DK006]|uniref:hypothetical protein n=1 Tax=Kineococcus sp. SYSU DK006 TaxID=3383127 RepID=UPI003D7DD618
PPAATPGGRQAPAAPAPPGARPPRHSPWRDDPRALVEVVSGFLAPLPEQRLPGGRNLGAVRVGGTVRRPAGEQTSAVHALLRHLADSGFAGAPRPLGLDAAGREVLTHLEGETTGAQRPWPSWVFGEDALRQVGRWLRGFHAASATFAPPPGARWFGERDEVRSGEVVGHHDAAPYEAVWRRADGDSTGDGELVGFVDRDLAGSAPALRDLAFTALQRVPLTAAHVAAADGWPAGTDRRHRLRVLLEAYGWTGTTAQVLDAVRERAREHADGLRAAAADGWAPAVALVAEGVAEGVADDEQAAAQLPQR